MKKKKTLLSERIQFRCTKSDCRYIEHQAELHETSVSKIIRESIKRERYNEGVCKLAILITSCEDMVEHIKSKGYTKYDDKLERMCDELCKRLQ